MKWLLILWMVNGFKGPVEQLRIVPFDDEAACKAAHQIVNQKANDYIRGVCVPQASKP